MKARQQFLNAYGISLTKKKHFELFVFLICLETILSFSYLGFIQIAPISVTTLHILVIVAAMYFGPWEAAGVAAIFGLASMWKASLTSIEIGDIIFSPTLSGKSFESITMALGARIAFALIAGLLFRWFFSKERKHRMVGIAVISIVTTLIHSMLVYLCMAGWFGAADTETTEAFSKSLIINNLILYTLTVLVAIGFDRLIRRDSISRFFDITCKRETYTRGQSKVTMMLTVLIVLFCIFICMHFMSRLSLFLQTKGTHFEDEYVSWIYGLIAQFLVGFAATFGILALFFRWMQEYFSALTLEANMKARENAESANKQKTFFLFNMSHDIRTPMNAIVGFIDKAKRHKDNPEILDDSLKKASDSSSYLLTMINDILDMAKIEAGKFEIHEELSKTTTCSDAMMDVFVDAAAKKDITLHKSYEDITHVYLWQDENHTSRIIANLLSNAIKYTEPGGEIWYKLKELPGDREGYVRTEITIRDTGKGMSKEFVEKIFDPFERAESATKSKTQGTGLGMSIVKRLVDLMGGEIKIDSEPGKGTTITVTLENRIATSDEIKEYELHQSELRSVSSKMLASKKVLLVEDNELNREVAEDILEEIGLVVETAGDGSVAVKKLKEKGPDYYDYILMDIQMPVMNGYEATKAIREMYPDGLIPIIALSANAFDEDKQASLSAGMDDHVAKPIDIKELTASLTKFL